MNLFVRRTAMLLLLSVAAASCRSARPEVNTAPAASAGPAMPAGVTPELIARGDSIFHAQNASCGRCHGPNAEGGRNAPSLRSGAWLHTDGSFEQISAIIVSGVPRDRIKDATRTFAMNPRGGPMNLTDDQARALGAYVWSISRSKTKE